MSSCSVHNVPAAPLRPGAMIRLRRRGPVTFLSNLLFARQAVVDAVDSGARMDRAVIRGVDLSGVDFTGQSFRRTRFVDVDLTGANFSGCDLRRTVFDNVNLTDADLRYATAHRSEFLGARMVRTDLRGFSARNALFSAGVMREVYGRGCDLNGSQIGADLYDSDFSFARLRNCYVIGWNEIANTSFDGSDIRGLFIDSLSHLGAGNQWPD